MAKKETALATPDEILMNKIYVVRGQKVMIDSDLAELYGVATKVLNQAVKRNSARFPSDFMFELTRDEYNSLRSQIVTLENGKGKYSKYNPFAFTEQGVAMLSGVLNSDRAISVNIQIMRIFTRIRQMLVDNTELRLAIEQLRKNTDNNTKNIELVFQYLDELLDKKEKTTPRKQIGYKMKGK